MTIEAQTTNTTNAADAAPAAAPAAPKAADKPVEAKPAPAVPAAALAPEGPRAPLPPTKKLLIFGDDDEIPNDADLIELSPRALRSRLDRATKKELRDRFGSDNIDDIKLKLDRLSEYEAKEEQQRLAQMTEIDRYKEQLAKSEEARHTYERRWQREQEARIVDREEGRVSSMAAKHIDSDMVEEAVDMLAKAIRNGSAAIMEIDERDLERDPDGTVAQWFQALVEKKPKYAKASGSPAPAPEPKKVPITNGADVNKPTTTAQSGTYAEKTAAPGRPNSMTDTEWKQYKRQMGLVY